MKTIQETAALAGVATSTLRYYDEIGLLEPRTRSSAGYRLYGREELLRLREIVIWRELGFPLAEIARLVDDPNLDRAAALEDQLELAEAQLERLRRITTGLEHAIAALREEKSVAEEEIFAGLKRESSWTEVDERDARPRQTARPASFAFLSGLRDPTRAIYTCEDDGPARICTTDPIRLAEVLLALGIVPVGAGTYEDRFSEARGTWPWPPLIEGAVRRQIRNVGHYGSDLDQIEAVQPDLIIDLFWPATGQNLAGHVSEGRSSLSALSSVAPTELIEIDPGVVPAFTFRLPEVARVLGRETEAQALLRTWAARTDVLRAHLEGTEVAFVSCWKDELSAPTARHPCQVLTSVGLRLTPVHGPETENGYSVLFEEGAITELDAPTLFLNTRFRAREQVDHLLFDKLGKHVSAVRRGRVVDLGMEFVNSGWFSAHWQLQLIARAFGLTPLRAGEDDDAVYATLNSRDGRTSLATLRANDVVTLRGPLLPARTIAFGDANVVTVGLDREGVEHMARFPESYTVTRAGEPASVLEPDRESALERILRRADRGTRSQQKRTGGRKPRGSPQARPAAHVVTP